MCDGFKHCSGELALRSQQLNTAYMRLTLEAMQRMRRRLILRFDAPCCGKDSTMQEWSILRGRRVAMR